MNVSCQVKYITFFKIPFKMKYLQLSTQHYLQFFAFLPRLSVIAALILITFVLVILLKVAVLLVLAFTVIKTTTQVCTEKPALQRWHQLDKHRSFEHLHLTSCMIASGAGARVVITGTYSSFSIAYP